MGKAFTKTWVQKISQQVLTGMLEIRSKSLSFCFSPLNKGDQKKLTKMEGNASLDHYIYRRKLFVHCLPRFSRVEVTLKPSKKRHHGASVSWNPSCFMLIYDRFSQLKVISYAWVTSLSSKSHAGILNFRRTVFCPNWSFLRCPTISILWRAPLYLRGCTVNHLRSTSQAFCQIISGIPSTSPKRMFSIGPILNQMVLAVHFRFESLWLKILSQIEWF